jgi:hypothetical protein
MFYAKYEIIFTIYFHIKLHILDSSSRLVLVVKMKVKLMQFYPFVTYFTTMSLSLHTTRDKILKKLVTIGFCKDVISYFSGAVSVSQCLASRDRMMVNNELERMWKPPNPNFSQQF